MNEPCVERARLLSVPELEARVTALSSLLDRIKATSTGHNHALSCASIEWGWDGIEGDSGEPCDCYISILKEEL